MRMLGLYRNPASFGRTPSVEAYRIVTCPTCAWPATQIIDLPAESGRTIQASCTFSHTWTVSWRGPSQIIHRQPVE